jgi:hypothetical protein
MAAPTYNHDLILEIARVLAKAALEDLMNEMAAEAESTVSESQTATPATVATARASFHRSETQEHCNGNFRTPKPKTASKPGRRPTT